MKRVALVLLVLTAIASADDRKAAERLFRAGEKAYKAQKFLIAAQNFEQAYEQFPAPEIAFSAGQAYRRQYRVDPDHTEYAQLAVKYYQLYMKDAKDSGTRLGDAADSLGEMSRVLEHLNLSSKTTAPQEKKTLLGVSVVFADHHVVTRSSALHEVDEASESKDEEADAGPPARAFIDGKPVELDALIEVAPGDHAVRAEAEGYAPLEQTAHVVAGAPRNAELTLQPLPAKVTVTTEAGASLIVDGRGVGEAPHAALPLAGGSHVITIVRPGRTPVAREVVVSRDQKLALDIPLHPTLRRRAVPWVIGVGGVFVLGTGVMLLGANHYDTLASSRLKELDAGDKPQSVLADYNTYRNRRDVGIDLAIISGTTAVAIGLTAAWLYYFDTPSAEGVKVVPFTASGTGGAAIFGQF